MMTKKCQWGEFMKTLIIKIDVGIDILGVLKKKVENWCGFGG
jgi:hypothetical protein